MSVSIGGGHDGTQAAMNGTGIGYGSESGSEASVTKAGISGLAGDTSVRSDKDSSHALIKNWDGKELQQDVEAQAKIMESFGKQAALSIGTYATMKLNDLKDKIRREDDPAKRAQLQSEATNWEEGGAYRTALHAAAGALGGGLAGAAGATASSVAMPLIAEQIDKMDAPEAVKQALSQVAAAALGAAVGGSAGLTSSVHVEANNRQLAHLEKEIAEKLAALSKGKYTSAQIEDQMRGMTAKINGEKEPGIADIAIGGIPSIDNGGTWIYAGTSSDGLPIISQQLAPVDAELRAFIVQNTTGSAVPSLITYDGPYNAPTYSTTPGPMETAKCASTAADCAAGISNETQAEKDERRNNSADFFNALGTESGRFGAAATAYGAYLASQPNVASQAGAAFQFSLAGTATIVGFGADVIKQLLRPNVGEMTTNSLSNIATKPLLDKFPIYNPIIYETLEILKNSQTSINVQNIINEKK